MITGSQIPDSLAWSAFFRHVEGALNAGGTNPEMIKGIPLHTTNLSETDQADLKGVCIAWAIDHAAIQAAHRQAAVNGTETGATVRNTRQKTANLSLAKAAELKAQMPPAGWKVEIQRHKNAIRLAFEKSARSGRAPTKMVPSQLAPNKDWPARSAWARLRSLRVRAHQVSCAFDSIVLRRRVRAYC